MPALTNGLRMGGEHDTLLVLCESAEERLLGICIEERELPSELWTLAVSVIDSDIDSELELVEMSDSGVEYWTLLLSPWKGVAEGVELCSGDVLELLVEPYDVDGNILVLSIVLGLKE